MAKGTEHPFRLDKHKFSFQKSSLRSLERNLRKIHMLADLTISRRHGTCL